MTDTPKPRARRTWSAFGDNLRRMPSEYEIVSHDTNWTLRADRKAPLEQNSSSPANLWLTTYRDNTPLKVADWLGFRDPDALTYRRYVAMQDEEETKTAGILDQDQDLDGRLSPEWARTLLALFTATRYPMHGIQMIQAYIAQIAPSSYITNAAALASADALRRVSLVSYRTRELQVAQANAGFGAQERRIWEANAHWQPARKVIEQALIAYDFGEALTATNLVLLPVLDDVLLTQFAELARLNGDEKTRRLLGLLTADSERRDRWTTAVLRHSLAENPSNEEVLRRWVDRWTPRADSAVAGLAELFTDLPAVGRASDEVVGHALAARDRMLDDLGLVGIGAATV